MAWPEFDPASGYYRICFRYGGRKFQRSRTLKIRDENQAWAKCGVVDETIRHLENGLLTPPEGVEIGEYILSGGRVTPKMVIESPPPPRLSTLGDVFDLYERSTQAKEASTLGTERTHRGHLLRILGRKAVVEQMTKADVQAYVDRRSKEAARFTGRPIDRETIKKEIGTLSTICSWAMDAGHIKAVPPMQKLRYPKKANKPPFQTWTQIEREIARSGLSGAKIRSSRLWESLYLNEDEIQAVLEHVEDHPVYPMFVFAAYTGARRNEMCHAEVGDIDFENGVVRIREKKRERTKSITFRHVPMHPDLREVMAAWIGRHPGGKYLFGLRADARLTQNAAQKRFRAALKGSRWEVLHGWHTFRHSFASNLARRGVPQAHIDAMMGHQTETMRERYRHLFPQDLSRSVGLLFSGAAG